MIAPAEVTMQMPEDQLVARLRVGDLDAFGQVYAQYGHLVFRYAYHQLGHSEDAKDIRQQTFVNAYQSLGSFRGQCSLQTWLLRICRNLCRDRQKSWSRRTEVLCDPQRAPEFERGSDLAVDPYEEAERSYLIEVVTEALRKLPPAQREILILREVEGLSTQEIAEVLGCSRGNAAIRLFRARQRLQKIVEPRLNVKE